MNKHVLTILHGVIGVALPVGLFAVQAPMRDVSPAAVVFLGIFALAMPSIIATRVSWAAGFAAGVKHADARRDRREDLTGPMETRIKR